MRLTISSGQNGGRVSSGDVQEENPVREVPLNQTCQMLDVSFVRAP